MHYGQELLTKKSKKTFTVDENGNLNSIVAGRAEPADDDDDDDIDEEDLDDDFDLDDEDDDLDDDDI